ncbi:Pimeloyl-ACP methyl ester carboxylesterase [Rathayibacter oskolensis]|uniref:Pimeloyl-ACP methyl ester carboxylesterase n=1 Tax=Rathayibacter oskolensis TaxID=1891671 RepID=A0A1X7P9R0_9MICO|nr:alpha/beta hydrolase [Rathayibacter oskolensis]SMH47299.1 Pimeloyl-ACP methyl ester carboxylesterase [Rathayibacter oskolensis]
MSRDVTSRDVATRDGRILRVHDSGPRDSGRTLLWHHGSPQTGALLAPVLEAAEARRVRLVSYGRPAYGGSSALPGRDVASAAEDVRAVLDALGVRSTLTMGASGGGPHALACAALLPDRVEAVAVLASPAPFDGEPGWFDGMAAPGGLRAALAGRDARAAFALVDEFDPESFLPIDYAAFDGDWSALGEDVARSAEWGDDGLIDDDVALASDWGVDLALIRVPVVLVQGGLDRVVPAHHAERLRARLPLAEHVLRPDDGHISVLRDVPAALDRLIALS